MHVTGNMYNTLCMRVCENVFDIFSESTRDVQFFKKSFVQEIAVLKLKKEAFY